MLLINKVRLTAELRARQFRCTHADHSGHKEIFISRVKIMLRRKLKEKEKDMWI